MALGCSGASPTPRTPAKPRATLGVILQRSWTRAGCPQGPLRVTVIVPVTLQSPEHLGGGDGAPKGHRASPQPRSEGDPGVAPPAPHFATSPFPAASFSDPSLAKLGSEQPGIKVLKCRGRGLAARGARDPRLLPYGAPAPAWREDGGYVGQMGRVLTSPGTPKPFSERQGCRGFVRGPAPSPWHIPRRRGRILPRHTASPSSAPQRGQGSFWGRRGRILPRQPRPRAGTCLGRPCQG